MPLNPGAKLGPYEIITSLGAGGMGEVYRALDPRIGRDVAVNGAFSPDGKWIAYLSDESGENELYVRSVGGPAGRWQVSTNGATSPAWKQQNELIYMEGLKVMRVAIQTSPTFSAATPEKLFEGPYSDMDPTSDDQHFIVVTTRPQGAAGSSDRLNVVISWFDEVRRLMNPTSH